MQLPKDVTFTKEQLSYGMAYVFRHKKLGKLGRIVLQGMGNEQCHISCEIAGDPRDPMTKKREEIFKPLSKEIVEEMDKATQKGSPYQEWKEAQAQGKKIADNIKAGIPPDPFSSVNKRLDARITEFLTQIVDRSVYESFVREWEGDDAVDGNTIHMDPRYMEAFSQWMIFDKIVPGKSCRIIELFAKKWMDNLPADEKALLVAQLKDRPSIFQIIKMNPEKRKYLVKDLLATETIHIHDRSTSSTLKVNDIFIGRAIPIEGKTVAYGLLGSVLTIPAPRWRNLSKALQQWKIAYRKKKPKGNVEEFFRTHHTRIWRRLWQKR